MSPLAALVVLALADPGAVHLEWRAPAGCPTAEEVQAQLDDHLVDSPRGEGTVEAAAIVSRRGRGYTLSLRTVVHGQPGARTLKGRECASLARAAALVVALAIDPTIGDRGAEDEATSAASDRTASEIGDTEASTADADEPIEDRPVDEVAPPEPEVVEPEVRAPTAPTTPPPRRSLRERFALRLIGGAEVGALPRVGGLAGASLGFLWRRARIELTGVYLPRQRVTVSYEREAGEATFQIGAAGLRGCGQIARGRVTAPLCGGIEAGVLDIVTEGFRPLGSRRAPWVAATAGAHLIIQLQRVVGVVVGAELVVPFTRPTTLVGGTTTAEVHRPAPVSGRFAAGIELRFP